jgi:excisionase family DNA binding protein
VAETQMGAASIPAAAGAVAEVAARERYLNPEEAEAYLNVSVGFIRRMASERRVRHYRLGKFIRFDPADLDAFAEVKEPLSGPDPTLVTQVWRRSRRLS